jgi:hypothetical protein
MEEIDKFLKNYLEKIFEEFSLRYDDLLDGFI